MVIAVYFSISEILEKVVISTMTVFDPFTVYFLVQNNVPYNTANQKLIFSFVRNKSKNNNITILNSFLFKSDKFSNIFDIAG
jgi:hypothetical protein